MRLSTPRPSEFVVALIAGVSIAIFLAPVSAWAVLVAALSSVATLGLRQRPVTATLMLTALPLSYAALLVPPENPAALAPGIIAMYSLGRHSSLPRTVGASLVYLVCALVAIEFTVASVIFATMLFGSAAAFGRAVARRSSTARTSRSAASALAATNVDGLAVRLVANERARLGGQALEIVRRSVEAMQTDASAAIAGLDPHVIENIAERGRTAIAELRRLLGLLRNESTIAPPAATRRKRFWVADAAVIAVLLVVTALDGQIPGQAMPNSFGWLLLVALPFTVLLRRIHPPSACLAAAILVGAAALIGSPLFLGTGTSALVTLSLLAWSAAVSGTTSACLGLGLLATATLWLAIDRDAWNIPVLLVLFGLPAFAGYEWSAEDRDGRAAEARAASLRAAIDTRLDAAMRSERLRIARDLHDVTSHAVGVMVLQATAALTMRESNAGAAREALRTVESTGNEALSELTELFDLLDAGVIGPPGLAKTDPESIETLVGRMREAGIRIALENELGTDEAISAPAAQILYRVAQEALTNVARHAPSSAVRVQISVRDDQCEVLVVNDGRESVHDDANAGFGLAGLTERVRAAGGRFAAGPQPGGGYRVLASLPCHAVAGVDNSAMHDPGAQR